MVVAQLVEQSLLTPEICNSNPVVGKFLFTINYFEKAKIQKRG